MHIGLHHGYVLPTVLDRSQIVIPAQTRSGETGCWCWVHQLDLGSRHVLCQWKDCLLPQGHNWKSIPENSTHWRNSEEHQVQLKNKIKNYKSLFVEIYYMWNTSFTLYKLLPYFTYILLGCIVKYTGWYLRLYCLNPRFEWKQKEQDAM